MLAGQPTEAVPELDVLACANEDVHGFVLRAEAVRVQHHDDSAPGHRTGEAHDAVSGGDHDGSATRAQIDPEMTRTIRSHRRIEGPHDAQWRRQRGVEANGRPRRPDWPGAAVRNRVDAGQTGRDRERDQSDCREREEHAARIAPAADLGAPVPLRAVDNAEVVHRARKGLRRRDIRRSSDARAPLRRAP
jgi:hypothetical protein